MLRYMKEGWSAALRQKFLLLAMAVYRFGWALALYELASSIVEPLLQRYPGAAVSSAQSHLFAAESEFRLVKTDLSHDYVWLLGILLAIRMIVTPLLNAGIYYSLANTHLNAGYRFMKGIRELGGSFTLYYLLQTALACAPLAYLAPKATALLAHASSFEALLRELLPYAAGCLAWGFAVKLLFTLLQFARTEQLSLGRSLAVTLRCYAPIIALTLLLLAVSLGVAAAAMTATFVWAGFWTLLAYQAYRLLQTLLRLWELAAQHKLFQDKAAA
ncbi:MAG: hypothetical protein J7639_25890 [Paenibacillaceae bacterium]|nr:hypothetical protein [Paenibacillaceae bacterium]